MNVSSVSVLWLCLLVLLMFSAFFSAATAALYAFDHYRLMYWLEKKRVSAIKLHALLQRSDHLSALTALARVAVYSLAAGLMVQILLDITIEPMLAPAAIFLVLILFLFIENLGRVLGGLNPEPLAFFAVWFYIPLVGIIAPFEHLFNKSLRLLGIKPKLAAPYSKQLLTIADYVEPSLPDRYRNVLLSLRDLETASVEEIMTPRKDIIGLDLEDPLEKIITNIQTSIHTRLPVYAKSIDSVLGFVHLRTMLALLSQPDFDKHKITDHLIKAFFVPAGTSIQRQMQNFKTEHLRIGLVVDEYGDVLGLISLDDLLQEIVGELISDDEFIQRQTDGGYLVNAAVSVRELNRVLHWHLPTTGPKTLNGLIVEYLELIPVQGACIKLHGHALEIIACDENKIKQVKFYTQD